MRRADPGSRFFHHFNSLATKNLASVLTSFDTFSVGGAWPMSCHMFQWNHDPIICQGKENRNQDRMQTVF